MVNLIKQIKREFGKEFNELFPKYAIFYPQNPEYEKLADKGGERKNDSVH